MLLNHSNIVYTGLNNLSFLCRTVAAVQANLMKDVQQGKTALPASHRSVAGICTLQVAGESMDSNMLRPFVNTHLPLKEIRSRINNLFLNATSLTSKYRMN